MTNNGGYIPILTDATAATDEELLEATCHFLRDDPKTLSFQRASGGVNNICYYVQAHGQKYLLRIYNNGNNSARVAYEHEVLKKLSTKSFSFKIPTLIPSIEDANRTHVVLKSGTEACLFECFEGSIPSLSSAKNIGAATAELLAGMADMKIDLPLPNPLYRNIYEAHHKITRDLFFDLIKQPVFDAVRVPTNRLVEELTRCEKLVEDLLAGGGLPEQQIHADLHVDNVLASGDNVNALLDFEFSAYDWRGMEMAVGLSKYVGVSSIDIRAAIEQWVSGYAEAGGTLSQKEINYMPDLIVLRILSNVVYFAGRAVAGEDAVEALTSRVQVYANRCDWIENNREWLVQFLTSRVLE